MCEKLDKPKCLHLAAFYVDFQEAFDKVHHSLLIKSLFKSGKASSVVKLIESYMENEAKTVKIQNNISSDKRDTGSQWCS